MASEPRILLTGATGFIGGTILSQLLSTPSPSLSKVSITCLVRGQDRVAKLRDRYGDRVNPVVYGGLDDIKATIAIAAEHDIVINTTNGYHAPSGTALIDGLAKRKAATGQDVWMIHTSGTSNLADLPITGKWVDKVKNREFDDAKDDIYGFEKERDTETMYGQRTAELGVIDTGLEHGVKTLVIMSPTIYGKGTGLFNNISIQIPVLVRTVLDHGRGVVVGEGAGVWDNVHVVDLAELYKVIVLEVLKDGGKRVPSGKQGIIFSGNGRHTWLEISQGVANACYEEGKLPDAKVEKLGLTEMAQLVNKSGASFDETTVELALCSNSRTIANVGKTLGWKPTRGVEAWNQGFRDDVKEVLRKS